MRPRYEFQSIGGVWVDQRFVIGEQWSRREEQLASLWDYAETIGFRVVVRWRLA